MELNDRVVVKPRILSGKPVIAGARISVELIVNLLASGWTHEQILTNYPHLSNRDIFACVRFLADENFPFPALWR